MKNNLRVLAFAISLASLGSSQIFLLPHRKIDDASRFCTRSELNMLKKKQTNYRLNYKNIVPHFIL
jgi:hypothetical protein